MEKNNDLDQRAWDHHPHVSGRIGVYDREGLSRNGVGGKEEQTITVPAPAPLFIPAQPEGEPVAPAGPREPEPEPVPVEPDQFPEPAWWPKDPAQNPEREPDLVPA